MTLPNTELSLGDRIRALDTGLFAQIQAQLTDEDRRSLLALHAAARDVYDTFSWLEIGSHLGGSLQVLVRDPKCRTIVSIDPRPLAQPDERGVDYPFADNSTERMMRLLTAVPDSMVEKVTTFEATAADVNPANLASVPQICFIDGEHTDRAALIDARFCRMAMKDVGCIAFHDAAIIYHALARFLDELREQDVDFRPYFLPNTVFVVELGGARLLDTDYVTGQVMNNYRGYLSSLEANDIYRQFFNRRTFKWARTARSSLGSMRRRARSRPS